MERTVISIKAGDRFKIGDLVVLVESVGKSVAKLDCSGGGEKITLLGAKDPLAGTIWEGQ